MKDHYDTIVVGAGASGLMTARQLARAGQRVVVLEARERIGGRILTEHRDVPLELGAEFVHGLPPITWNLMREARLGPRELTGTPYRYAAAKLSAADAEPSIAFDAIEAMSRWHAAQPPGTDVSFARYLSIAGLTDELAQQAIRYVEGFNAADCTTISVAALARQQAAEDAIQADRLFHIAAGYEALPRYLADQFLASAGQIRLSHPVQCIEWRQGQVVASNNTSTVTARHLVLTVPLGVLKAGVIRFLPAIDDMGEPLSAMEMGPVRRVALRFHHHFWDGLAPRMLFLFSPGNPFPTWWTAHPDPTPMITGWIGGATAVANNRATTGTALVDLALHQLAAMFNTPYRDVRANLLAGVTHDWLADPWSRGAYSYARVGGVDASAKLARSIVSTLFFAGEHTDSQGHWGTVHAALASGERAAREVLSSA